MKKAMNVFSKKKKDKDKDRKGKEEEEEEEGGDSESRRKWLKVMMTNQIIECKEYELHKPGTMMIG